MAPVAFCRTGSYDLGGDTDNFSIPAYLRKKAEDVFLPNPAGSRQGIDKRNSMFWKHPLVAKARTTGLDASFSYVGITPAGLEKWLAINDPALWPLTYAGLIDLGLGITVCEWLELGAGADRDEAAVVSTFLSVVREFGFASLQGIRKAVQTIKSAVSLGQPSKQESTLAAEIRSGLRGVTGQAWPQAVVNFPECVLG